MDKAKVNYEDTYFRATTVLIKLAAAIIGLTLLFFSHYGFVFYSIAMIPAVIVTFIDRQYQACASATVCTFNLVGIMPYLAKLWDAPSMDLAVKTMSTDISTWVVIYGCALLGQTLYWVIPPVIAKLYTLKAKVEVSILNTSKEKLCAEWNIKYTITDPKDKKKDE